MGSKKVEKLIYLLKKFKKPLIVFWAIYFFGLICVVLIFSLAGIGVIGKAMPELRQLENPETNLATQIYSADGVILGKYYQNDNRTPITFDELPKNMIDALIATEDERFYEHPGIDWIGTVRALFYLGKRGGGSTITQQLARQLFMGVRSRNKREAVIQKMKEWILSVQLEQRYTKNEILTMYLNIYDFGYHADGVKSAAKIYFGKKSDSLSIEESATLVGMLKNSSLYNPVRRPEMVKKRRNVVFSQMHRNNLLTDSERDSLQNLPLQIRFTPESHREGTATYFRAYLHNFIKSWVKENKKPDGTKYNIYADGLRIYTTIDSRLQILAENALKAHMKNLQKEFTFQNTTERNPTAPFLNLRESEIDMLMRRAAKRSNRWRNMISRVPEDVLMDSFYKKVDMRVFSWKGEIDTLMSPMDSIRYYKHFLRGSLMSMEPQTGHIKAWVGGFDFKHFQYDQVKQGRRQIGSTFKPFLYATAIDQLKLSPCDSLPDALYCIEAMKHGNAEVWCPKNSGERYDRVLTLKNALANSVNTISARLMDQVGPRPVINLVRKMGITSYIPPVPSIALGTPDISLYELVGSYGSFANKGIYVKPFSVLRIEDRNGTTLFEATPETRDVLSEEVAYVTVNLLKGVTENGSGVRLRHAGFEKTNYVYRNLITGYPYVFENPIAGKTGTTQNQSDGWFVGMTPNLVTGVWVGGEDRSIHFKGIAFGQGATMALPIWALYMKAIYEKTRIRNITRRF